jgi:hypothetical protein
VTDAAANQAASDASDPIAGLIATMMPMMMQMMQQQTGGTAPGEGAYRQRRHLRNWRNDAAFSFAREMSPQGLGAEGSMMDLGMRMFAPGLAANLQANARVDPFALRQQNTIQQALLAAGSMGAGKSLADALGAHLDWAKDGTAANQFITSMGPMAAQIPGVQSLLRSITPTAMFEGSQYLVQAAQLQDPDGRLDARRADAVIRAFDETTRTGPNKDRVRTTVTNGFNRDEYADILRYTADQQLQANDLDRTQLVDDSRKSLINRRNDQRVKDGQAKMSTTEEDQFTKDSDTQIQYGADAANLMRATSYQSRVFAAASNALGPDATMDDLKAFQQDLDIKPQTDEESKAAEQLIYKFKALADATGTTVENLVNAGKVIQNQYGGSMSFATNVAGQAALEKRHWMDSERAAGRAPSDAAGNQRQEDSVKRRVEANNAEYNALFTSIANGFGSPGSEEKIQQAARDGDIDKINAIMREEKAKGDGPLSGSIASATKHPDVLDAQFGNVAKETGVAVPALMKTLSDARNVAISTDEEQALSRENVKVFEQAREQEQANSPTKHIRRADVYAAFNDAVSRDDKIDVLVARGISREQAEATTGDVTTDYAKAEALRNAALTRNITVDDTQAQDRVIINNLRNITREGNPQSIMQAFSEDGLSLEAMLKATGRATEPAVAEVLEAVEANPKLRTKLVKWSNNYTKAVQSGDSEMIKALQDEGNALGIDTTAKAKPAEQAAAAQSAAAQSAAAPAAATPADRQAPAVVGDPATGKRAGAAPTEKMDLNMNLMLTVRDQAGNTVKDVDFTGEVTQGQLGRVNHNLKLGVTQ